MYLTVFIFGILGGSLALLIELATLDLHHILEFPFTFSLSSFIVLALAAAIEESTRYLLLRQYLRSFLLSGPLPWQKIFLIGTFFSMGFASLELFLILRMGNGIPLRAFGIAFVHFLSIFMAFVLTKKLPLSTLVTMTIAIALHFSYNLATLFI
jgi:hypothetical protein